MLQQVSSTSNTSESTTSPSDSLPDLNWFVDPPPKDLPPRWLRPFNATSTQTFTTPELTDTTPTALQTYLNDHQAMDVQHLDLTDVHDLCQDLVVATFSHPGHLQSVAKDLKHQFKKLGMLDLVVDGMESQEWIVMDLGHVWVHLFCSEAREKYNIEGLWLRIKELHHEVMDPTMLEKKEGSIPALNMDPFEVFTNELQKEEEEEEEKYAQVRRQ
ncbi:hypothetical protein HMI55_002969 [Coelomomyces lativittatus]|nr:hypothetical protein HMI55_002969 [Coelomomyces lativittatus]